MEAFDSKGRFVVPVGELESFVRSVGGHGPKWVSEVLKKDLANDPELDNAKSFVQSIFPSIKAIKCLGSPIKRSSVKENASRGEETTIVALLRYRHRF